MNAVSARSGGIATYTRNMIMTLGKEGVEARIAVPPNLAPVDPAVTINVDVGRYSPWRRFYWEQAVWRRTVNSEKPDILFSSANFGLLNSSVRQLLLVREGGLFNPYYLKHVFPQFSSRTRKMHAMRRRLMLMSVRQAEVVMFPSETLRDWVARWEPRVMERAVINSYGINLARFTPRKADGIDRASPLRVTYVSVYYPHKDPMTFAKAVAIVRSQGRDVVGRLTMDRKDFGPWPDSMPEYQALKDHEARGDIVLGSIDSQALSATYEASDISVFPSLSETFGFPLVEAMASGVPVIAADTLTNREVCGPAALYFPPSDAAALADRINQLDARPDLYRWLRDEGLARAHRQFGWKSHLDRLVGIFSGMVRH
jgi:glycosyltransferase involved in cell wall biosynthesis